MATKPLSETYPALAAEWHPTKNQLTPLHKATSGQRVKVWWLGKCGHEWQANIDSRVGGRGCPVCRGQKVVIGFNDLETVNPELAGEWHPTKNASLLPTSITAGSSKRIWWLGKCGHEWIQSAKGRNSSGYGCPYCKNKAVLRGFNDLATTHPELAQEWHPNKNGKLLPTDLVAGAHKRIWWLGKCGHEWDVDAYNRTHYPGGCPYCAGVRVLIGFNDLATTHPELVKEWHPNKNGLIKPVDFSAGSGKKIYWICNLGHDWQVAISNRAIYPGGCPYCAGNKVWQGFNDLLTTNPAIAAEWHPTKNKTTPDKITAGSNMKIWWLGHCGHEWNISPHVRITSGCPKCATGGFSSVDPGLLYFIHHPKLMAFKVGITNQGIKTDRLKHFKREGWFVLKTWESDSGQKINETETKVLRWLRKDLGVPVMLDKGSMGTAQGASETFSDSILTQAEVIAKIEELLAQFEA